MRMDKVKVLEGGHVIQELTVEEALELIKKKFYEGQSVIIDGVYVDATDIERVKRMLAEVKEGISFFPLVGGG
jgi:hypothetical protein